MGSWNGTCGVSHLPIHNGDPVALIPLVRYPFSSWETAGAFCHTYEIWQPTFPIEAEYNDYGFVENEKQDDAFRAVMQLLKTNLIERPQGENEYHEQAVVRDQFDFKKFGEWVKDSRLSIKNPTAYGSAKAPTLPVSFMMVHKTIYDHYANRTFVAYFDDAVVSFERVTEILFEGFNQHDTHEAYFTTFTAAEKVTGEQLAKVQEDYFRSRDLKDKTDGYIREFYGVRDRLSDAERSLRPDLVKTLAESAAKLFMFNYVMGSLRMHYAPQSGAGSQDEDYEVHETLHKLKAKIMAERIAKYEE